MSTPSIAVRRRQAAERAAALRRHPTGRGATVELRPPPSTFYVIALVVTVFTMLGLVMVLSASSIRLFHNGVSPWRTFNRQVVWAILGAVAGAALLGFIAGSIAIRPAPALASGLSRGRARSGSATA